MAVNLEFFAADVLNMQLFEKDGKIWGAERKPLQFGVWSLSLWLEVHSDVVGKECGVWVSCTKRLWMYLMIDSRNTKIAVFDASEVGITMSNYSDFGGVSIKDTLQKLGGAVKAIFEFDGKGFVEVKEKAICN